MADICALEFIEEELLSDSVTAVYQLDDGTIFYYELYMRRLYVKWEGNEIYAQLPSGSINYMSVHGNAVYFETNRQIYKVSFSHQNALVTVECMRLQLEDEQLHVGGFCSIVRDGKTFIYRMSDDPEKDGIAITTLEDDRRMILKGIHRSKVIYTKMGTEIRRPSARMLSENVIFVELPESRRSSFPTIRDSCRFAYFADEGYLNVLDLEKLQFQKPLSFGDYMEGRMNCPRRVSKIVGVHEGTITVMSKRRDGDYLERANLPSDCV